ncbi:MAG: NADH-quinone oxidoreductase subunit G [Rhodospirillaceae bacterium]|nr:NADH-quinone oxidoreductase subunit G [Rhodospirillaceae bacterium]
MMKLTIDGIEVEVEDGSTVLQACEQAGAEVPRFCFHDRLSIAGNCRMCLVDLEKAPKPIASCAMPAGDGMVVHTNTPEIKKAREGVMEFLLINHPLDCPICDQGGECDLQDQAMAYGRHFSRYGEHKRAVKNKDVGPLIETIMTRCIHCTRCVRFADEIAGVEEFGAVFRGEHMEIGTYVEKAVSSELSGNMIDLCPVGALTSKPFAFTARSWELRKTESIDVLDAVGSSIRVDSRGGEVMRIVPRLNEDVNEEWISDKSRFACDGLSKRRLDRCYVRKDGKLEEASWAQAFAATAEALKGVSGDQAAAIAGDLADCESMTALKDLMTGLGSNHMDCRQDGAKLGGARAGYLFNTTIAQIEDTDAILIVGADPRWEASLVNARIRKRYLRGGLKVGVIGAQRDLTYPYDLLGAGPQTLGEIAGGSHDFCQTLSAAERPMLIVGPGAVARDDGAGILAAARGVAEKFNMVRDGWNGFNVLHKAASRVGGLDLGFVPAAGGRDVGAILEGAESGAIKFVWLLGADEIDVARLNNAFVVYQGHHGDAGAAAADVVLPGAAYTEKDATYVNLEGRVQRTRRAIFPPGEAREDWTILRAFSEVLGNTLPFDRLGDVRARMAKISTSFETVDSVTPAAWDDFGTTGDLSGGAFSGAVDDFYLTDVISRASHTMAQCSGLFVTGQQGKTGTDG